MTRSPTIETETPDLALRVYMLGVVDFDAALRLQRRIHFEVRGDRSQAGLILCEHPPLISVGRQGSHAHLRGEIESPRTQRFPVQWVNRGGGCVLHLPGQLAVYPIFPLDRMCLDVSGYVRRLGAVFIDWIANFSLRGTTRADATGIWVGDRLLGAFGVAVHDWVSHFGAYVNIHPALDAFRGVRTVPGCEPMTSLERERHGPVRPALVRQRLVEHFEARFGFTRTALFTDHPSLVGDARRCADTRRAGAGCG